jgi:hypothetical protein
VLRRWAGPFVRREGDLSAAAAQEQARFDSDYRFERGALFDAGGGVRLWSYLAVGVGVSRFRIEEAASAPARVPHPIYRQLALVERLSTPDAARMAFRRALRRLSAVMPGGLGPDGRPGPRSESAR